MLDCARSHLTSLEAHGTGTALGDPIEVGAAAAVCDSWALVSSLKANIGHSEPAAAASGFGFLVATALNASCLGPNTQMRRLNVHLYPIVAAKHAKFFVGQEETPRGKGAAPGNLSSFGFSGTIAHASVCVYDGEKQLQGFIAQSSFRSRLPLTLGKLGQSNSVALDCHWSVTTRAVYA